jgi:putative flippase GtrA
MKIIETIMKDARLRQLLLYAVCGGTGVLTDLFLYTALMHYGVNYQAANAAGYATGTLASFMLNRHFTFQVYDKAFRRLALFFGTALIGYLASSALLWVLVSAQGYPPLPSKIATLAVVLVLQFTLNRAVTFRASTDNR